MLRGAESSIMNLLGMIPPGVDLSFLMLEEEKVAATTVLAHTSGTNIDQRQDFMVAPGSATAYLHLTWLAIIYGLAVSRLKRTSC